MDLCRIDRLTEIGQANAMPMRQFRTNQRPIDTPFWIGNFSSIRENWGQSYAMQESIRCQSWFSQTDNLLPIQCQSVTSRLPIQCRWLANPMTILCQSVPNPVPICFQFTLQSGSNPSPIYSYFRFEFQLWQLAKVDDYKACTQNRCGTKSSRYHHHHHAVFVIFCSDLVLGWWSCSLLYHCNPNFLSLKLIVGKGQRSLIIGFFIGFYWWKWIKIIKIKVGTM